MTMLRAGRRRPARDIDHRGEFTVAWLWFGLLLVSLGANIALVLMNALCKTPLVDLLGRWIGDFVRGLRHRKLWAFWQ